MKAKITPNMISFVTVRRGDWIIKVSVYKNRQIMIIAHHCYELERVTIQYFTDQNDAADYLERLAYED